MSMENKMTPEEEEKTLAEATKALPYLNNKTDALASEQTCSHYFIDRGICKLCGHMAGPEDW